MTDSAQVQPNPQLVARIHRAAMQLFAEKGSPQVTISELAEAAGIARGSVYNHIPSPERLFETIASQLAEEMHARVVASFNGSTEPAQRLANGIRYFIRRAHEDPYWGRFFARFAPSQQSLQGMWTGATAQDVVAGLSRGQYSFRPEQLATAIALIAGTTLTSMLLVLEGHRGWREAGSDAAELVLRAFGVGADAARRAATAELMPLPQLR